MQATKKRLIGSVFPSGRWFLTGQTGQILSSDADKKTLWQFARENDCSVECVKNRVEWHWPTTLFGVPVMDAAGEILFNEHDKEIKFEKDRVSDDEIRLALAHAQQKFGNKLMLTGDDPVFIARMARLADDMGLTVLNPELQDVIFSHRASLAKFAPTVAPPMPEKRITAKRKLFEISFNGIQKVKSWIAA